MVSSCALRFFFGLGVGAFFYFFFIDTFFIFLLIPFLFFMISLRFMPLFFIFFITLFKYWLSPCFGCFLSHGRAITFFLLHDTSIAWAWCFPWCQYFSSEATLMILFCVCIYFPWRDWACIYFMAQRLRKFLEYNTLAPHANACLCRTPRCHLPTSPAWSHTLHATFPSMRCNIQKHNYHP